MNTLQSRLCDSRVVHRRYRPRRHQLQYRVYSLLIDLDELDALDQKLRLLSVNRLNLFSVLERDHGSGQSSGLKAWLLDTITGAGCQREVSQVMMLCFPRVLGYVFNPLTVYYCLDSDGDVQVIVYEVNNTFGGRHLYVIPTEQPGAEVICQTAGKQLYVSPFNDVAGQYAFRVTAPGDTLTVGVSLRVGGAPVLNALQTARTELLCDRTLWRAFYRMPFVTLKIIAGIHLEAAILWLKGLPIVPRSSNSMQTFKTPGVSAHND